MTDTPTPSKPIIVEARVAPALLVQAFRMGLIMAASGTAGHLYAMHPTIAGAFSDAQAFGMVGVALANVAWSMYARFQLCSKLRKLAHFVDDSIAIIRK